MTEQLDAGGRTGETHRGYSAGRADSEVPSRIQPLMQNSHHVDAHGALYVDEQMASDAVAPIACADLVALAAAARILGYPLDGGPDLVDVGLGLMDAPALFGEIPD